jgi:hypothetical protein
MPLGTAPLDLATVCNALTSGGLVRGIGYSWARSVGAFNGAWAWAFSPNGEHGRAEYIKRMRVVLGASADDIIAPGAYIDDPAIADPAAFVRRALLEHSTAREDA